MRGKRLTRALVAIVALVTTVAGFAAPASAGTLTSASFTASTPYTYTSAANTRYDYGFTTAATSTLSKVTMSTPAGTGGSNRYLAMNGVSGNSASTPDSSANSITGDIDIRVKAALPNWHTTSPTDFIAKWDYPAVQDSYLFSVNTTGGGGGLGFAWKDSGGTVVQVGSTVGTSFANNATGWVRVTLAVNTAGSRVVTFYTSSDGSTWNQLGSTLTGSPTSIADTNTPLVLGNHDNGITASTAKYYYAEVRNGINGTIANKFDPTDDSTTSPSSWNSSDGAAETWTVNRSGTNLPADIATDLNITGVTGLPSGGAANYRFIDGVATYNFTPTSVPSGTPCTVSLQGFTNTGTAGSYSSLITTYDNSGTPAAVDSVTTGVLVFAADSSSTSASVTVDPSFTFTVANQSSACNGESNFVTGAGTATAVTFGHLSAGANVSGGQALSVTGNSGGGFVVYVRGTQASQNLRSGSHNWTDVSGTYGSPAVLAGGEQFGFTYKDSTASSWVSNPAGTKFVALTSSNNAVMGTNSSMSGNGCISFDAQTAASTPAGSYSATIFYTAVPTF